MYAPVQIQPRFVHDLRPFNLQVVRLINKQLYLLVKTVQTCFKFGNLVLVDFF
jgi:hypothetical protein